MLFKAFQIKNYKSFVDSGICHVQDGVTILAGQNESGKTNILKALEKINEPLPSFSEEEHSFCDNEKLPEITYWFELSDDELKEIFELTGQPDIQKEVVVKVGNKMKFIEFETEPDKDIDSAAKETITKTITALIPNFILYQTLVDDIPDTFTSGDVNKKSIKRLSRYLGKDFTKIFSNGNHQRQKSDTERLSKNISDDFAEKYKQKNVSLEFDINSGTMSIYVHDINSATNEKGYPFKISQRSTGLKWYLNFYIALKGEDLDSGDVILVDEPGMYLHPKAQQEMRGILNEEGKNNQIIYTTHSPYLIDSENIAQIRLVEKSEVTNEDGFNEISKIKEKVHRSDNIDTIKPIIDAIGYSLGSELNFTHKKVLICEGVSDYYYIKALENIFGKNLNCGVTHANGCGNIGKVLSLFLGLGISDIYALFDSDMSGIRERNKLIHTGALDESNAITVGEPKNEGKAIEDIFDREWFMKNMLEYGDEELSNAATISKEITKNVSGLKYLFAKRIFEMTENGTFDESQALSEDAKKLFDKLSEALLDVEETEYDFEK